MSEYAEFKWGSVVYPLLPVAAGTPLLEVCDPALGALLQFIKTCITVYVGDALVSAAGALNVGDAVEVELPIGNVINIDPQRIGRHTTFKFPLLAGWRVRTHYTNRTTVWRNGTSSVRVAYVLPPLDADVLVNINPILTAIERVIDDRLFQGFDPNHESGSTSLFDAGVVNAKIVSSDRGSYQLADDLDFDTLVLDIEMEERQRPENDGLVPHGETLIQVYNATDQTKPPIDQVDMIVGS